MANQVTQEVIYIEYHFSDYIKPPMVYVKLEAKLLSLKLNEVARIWPTAAGDAKGKEK